MPFDSEGNFTRIHNWEEDRINGIEIVTEHHDAEDDNFAEAFNETFLRDGRVPMENHLNMGGFRVQNCSNAESDSDLVTKNQMDSFVESKSNDIITNLNAVSTIGDIKASIISQNHGSWLLCNGQAVSRTDYADLFKLIGTKFGAGDGVQTFNIPDYQGKFLRGMGGNSANNIASTQQESVPLINHRHIVAIEASMRDSDGKFITRSSAGSSGNYDYALGLMNADQEPNKGYTSLAVQEGKSSVSAGEHVTPINQAVYFFIKAKNV